MPASLVSKLLECLKIFLASLGYNKLLATLASKLLECLL